MIGDSTDPAVRARLVRDAAQAMGDDFTAGAAFATLAGERSRSVNYSIKSETASTTPGRRSAMTVRPSRCARLDLGGPLVDGGDAFW